MSNHGLEVIEARHLDAVERLNRGEASMSDGLIAMGDRKHLLSIAQKQRAELYSSMKILFDLMHTWREYGEITYRDLEKVRDALNGQDAA